MVKETITTIPQIISENCISCGNCISVCSNKAIELTPNFYCARCIRYCMTMDVPCKNDHITIIPELCNSCGDCVEACKNNALVMKKK